MRGPGAASQFVSINLGTPNGSIYVQTGASVRAQARSWFSSGRVRALVCVALQKWAVISCIALAGSSRAWARSEDIFLIYSASEGCPSRAQFENQVRARTARVRFIDEPGPGRFFRVYASVIDGHAAGGIISGASNSVSNMREVTSNDCDEVVSALALIVALALEPEASTTTSSSTPERSERSTGCMPDTLSPPRERVGEALCEPGGGSAERHGAWRRLSGVATRVPLMPGRSGWIDTAKIRAILPAECFNWYSMCIPW